MSWIKRNLYFFIGSVVAVLLMGLAGFYLYSKWQLNNEIMEKLNQDYAELQRLNQENPHPGSGQVDNIKAAKQQQEQLRQLVQKIREHFERIPAIPDLGTNITSQDYKSALDRTIAQLQRDATNASVILPPDYSFSFTAQRPRVTFAPGSLEPLSVQLGEVKAICDILFKAKINSLDNIRRVRVSPDDANGPQTEYLLKQSVTNDLAILTPYEFTFRCFSTELAAVLEGLGGSRYGLLVKSLNVEPAVTTTPGSEFMPGMPTAFNPIEAPPAMMAPPPTPVNPLARGGRYGAEAESAAAFARRYGPARGGPEGMPGGATAGGIPLRPLTPGMAPTPGYPTAPAAPAYRGYGQAAPAARGGLPTVLDEKQLKVTLNVDVVKLLPPK
jgi:hypothetical protein